MRFESVPAPSNPRNRVPGTTDIRQEICQFLKASIRRFVESIRAPGSANAPTVIRKFLEASTRGFHESIWAILMIARRFANFLEHIPDVSANRYERPASPAICNISSGFDPMRSKNRKWVKEKEKKRKEGQRERERERERERGRGWRGRFC